MNERDSSTPEEPLSTSKKAMMWVFGLYLIWIFVTYLLEGRIDLYKDPTISGRYSYVLIANVLIGTIGTLWIIRLLIQSRYLLKGQSGFRSLHRTGVTILLALLIGGIYFLLMRPASLTWLVTVNGYVQVLPVSIAEVLVCWALIGTSFESLTGRSGTVRSVLAGIAAATLFFSFYHIGHSAPFNQLRMMLFLLIPGFLTSLFYFLTREIYATILFHNFQGTIGVLGNLENPAFLDRPLYLFYLLLLISILVLISADRFLVRQSVRQE